MSKDTSDRHFPERFPTEAATDHEPRLEHKSVSGAKAGTLLGGLVGAGIPEGRAKEYEKGVQEGGVVVTVSPRSAEDAAHFEETWTAHEGARVHRVGSPV